jgi:hypothetical protein
MIGQKTFFENFMNEREYLTKAQEAEALADAAENPGEREGWENIAAGYRPS